MTLSIKRLTMTGIEIKALFSNPTVDQEETVNLVTGLLGAGPTDDVFIDDVTSKASVGTGGFTLVLTINPSGECGQLDPGSPFFGVSSKPYLALGGNLDAHWKVYGTDTLSDIPDSMVMNLYFKCGIVEDV